MEVPSIIQAGGPVLQFPMLDALLKTPILDAHGYSLQCLLDEVLKLLSIHIWGFLRVSFADALLAR